MVRFILINFRENGDVYYKSQFHYGSIHTIEAELREKIGKMSQFHYGSIHTMELQNHRN